MTSRPTPTPRQWSHHDTALWHTCDVLAKLRQGHVQALPMLAVPFAMRFGGHQERMLASGKFEWAKWTSLSDGSYIHNDSLFFATGGPGLALSAAFLGGRAFGNARRKRQARQDAEPRWVWGNPGLIHVSTHGYYLQSSSGLATWDWASIDLMQVTEPGTVRKQGRGLQGAVNWQIKSIWAELAFILWARARNPHHPQLIDGSWLPAGWQTWAAEQGRPAALTS